MSRITPPETVCIFEAVAKIDATMALMETLRLQMQAVVRERKQGVFTVQSEERHSEIMRKTIMDLDLQLSRFYTATAPFVRNPQALIANGRY